MYRPILTLVIALALAGCASRGEQVADELRDRERVMRDLEEDRRDWAQEDAKREIRRFPDWALEAAPAPDSTGIYAVGIADSDAPQVALRKANLQALYDLGRTMNQAVAGLERQRITDAGASSNDSYSLAVESVVDFTDVTGWETVRQEVLPIEGRVHAFVLLKLPFEAANRVVEERRRQALAGSEREAFDELQRRLEAFRSAQPAPLVAPQPAESIALPLQD